jgi:hypothetical protein
MEKEIEVTEEMIEAGLEAWRKSAGDEYKSLSITNHFTVEDIYRAMARAAPIRHSVAKTSTERGARCAP